ncbi:MAG: PIN domain-containing protein [Armatimonadota bacterium]|nr:PIN domain-containing protein [Armatimonadota bacterium]MDR7426431.1 PIN domain-containing protein [Armatimonadota bacterium]MDR7465216.1 PIN domain-containing protein [Armatimonadota bacterium]MDR7469562.1 PIN domain-containing protein [Armatimonadota bacterium]MDR7540484.1 PIN domain-containing protein [Armatimonadota bacterium]
MIFLDTSAIYALANAQDSNHVSAQRSLQALLEAGEELLTHNYVLLESVALLRSRLGWDVTQRFLAAPPAVRIRWVDGGLHASAVEQFLSRRGRYSLVDEISFLVMREVGVQFALSFDRDFQREGFLLYRTDGL